MVTKLSVYAWKDIMRVCGPITNTTPKDKISCRYIDLWIGKYELTAYGSNAIQISKVNVPCDADAAPYGGYHLLIPPMKTPAGTRYVEIHSNDEEKEYTVMFLDIDKDIISAVTSPMFDGKPLDYEDFYRKAQKNFDDHSRDGAGEYYIVVNPKLLLNALEGFKSSEKVILNFGSRVQPFMIRDFDQNVDATALIYPIRVVT